MTSKRTQHTRRVDWAFYSKALLAIAVLLLPAIDIAEDPLSPSVRNAHGMAYDIARGRMIVFGGADATQVLGDTWDWDGVHWRQISTPGPSPRTFPAMVYDESRKVVLLFGGNRVLFGKTDRDAVFLNDFWQWNGKRWMQIDVPNGPIERAEAAFAFDDARGRAVLFGGYRRAKGSTERLGDTWQWDGRRWTRVSLRGPSPRNGAAMVYDRDRRRVVLFGGPLTDGGGSETWEWDGREWSKNESAISEGRFNTAMTYDEERHRVIRFGGWNSKERTDDTCEYDGVVWKKLGVTGPASRNHSRMVYDRRRHKAVLFGGHDGKLVFGDVWEWDGSSWQQKVFTPPQERVENGH